MRVLVIFAVLFWVAPAVAQTRPLDAALSVPEGATCLTRAALVEHTASWLGSGTVDVRQTILIELGRGERVGVGFVLLDGEQVASRRRFARLPEACADRRAALSLALAIALDASVLERLMGTADAGPTPPAEPGEPPRHRDPEQVASEAAEPEPDAGPPSAASPERAAEIHLRAGLGAGLGVGLLPQSSPWGEFSFALSGAGWTLRALAGATWRAASPLAHARVVTQLAAGAVEVCVDRDLARLQLSGCLGPRLGRLFAQGRDFADSRSTELWWLALGAGLHARYPRDSVVSLRLGIGGHLALLRPVLRVVDTEGHVTERRTLARVGLSSVLVVVVALR
ncbi:MAG: hypothetical protein GXP55_13240 [Deltaproteobacteria bacterium]|nr:hypothetical protein [Deltaproteobacteria bacterium]